MRLECRICEDQQESSLTFWERGDVLKNDSLEDMQQQAQQQRQHQHPHQHQHQQHQTPSPFPDSGSRHPHGPSAEEWDAVKDVIRQLYVIEQCPLKGVKSVLETRYNFRATYDKSRSKQHPGSYLPALRSQVLWLICATGNACSRPG